MQACSVPGCHTLMLYASPYPKKCPKHEAHGFRVYLRGRLIDTVWFTGYTADEARRSLIDHDGYHPAIVVRA